MMDATSPENICTFDDSSGVPLLCSYRRRSTITCRIERDVGTLRVYWCRKILRGISLMLDSGAEAWGKDEHDRSSDASGWDPLSKQDSKHDIGRGEAVKNELSNPACFCCRWVVHWTKEPGRIRLLAAGHAKNGSKLRLYHWILWIERVERSHPQMTAQF